jgi:hypothetical protein
LKTIMATRPQTESHADGMRRLRAEHAQRLRQITDDANQTIARRRRHEADLVEQSTLHRQLLRTESMHRAAEQDRIEMSDRRGHRDFLAALGASPSAADRRQRHDEQAASVDDRHDPQFQRLAQWLDEQAARHRIDVRRCRLPQIANGSAARRAKWITVATERKNFRDATIELHELAHCVSGPSQTPDIKTDVGQSINVGDELRAWRWVLAHTPVWFKPMHDDLRRFLNTYRGYATTDEAAAIDRLCSDRTYYETRLRIAEGL